ncbi:MAG: ABC transporter permease [Bryobacteraceae bacterium]
MRDIRIALRAARKSPGSTAAALLTMALGLGASTAMFGVIDGVLLRPLPGKDPQRVVQLYQSYEGVTRGLLSMKDFIDWQGRVHSLESMAIYRMDFSNFTGGKSPALALTLDCDPTLLNVLGARPSLGRGFAADENLPGHGLEVLLAWQFWKTQFAGNDHIVGSKIYLDQTPYQIIGVLPKDFRFAGQAAGVSIWRPLTFDFKDPRNARGVPAYFGIGRLAPGATAGEASSELNSIQSQLAQEYPEADRGKKALCVPWREAISGNVRPALLLLFGAVGCVLLIACGNTASLMLVRAAGRQNEMSIRIALGANRVQLARQLLAESLLLSLTAAVFAVGAAWAAIQVIRSLPNTKIPNSELITLDWRTVAFASAMGVLTGVLFGLIPAWRGSDRVNDSLKQSSTRSSETRAQRRFRAVLVTIEAALAVMLSIGAGLLIHSFVRIAMLNPGFNPAKVLALTVSLSGTQYEAPGNGTLYTDAVLEKVRALPGVRDAAFGSSLPLGVTSGSGPALVEGEERLPSAPPAMFSYVTPHYFKTMGIPLVAGRDFDGRDNAHSRPVAIVNQAFARILLRGENPIDRQTKYYRQTIWRQIIGVVGDVPEVSFERGVEPEVYIPNAQVEALWTNLVARVAGDPNSMERAVKEKMAEVDPSVPAYSGRHSMADVVQRALGWRSFSTSILGIFAIIAILLASVGIYAVIAYSVAQRTPELGLRMALGAQPSEILMMVMRQGMIPTAVGAVAGALIAMGASRWLHDLLFRVTNLDPWAYLASVALVIGVTAAASIGPALRAAAVDPNRALRNE